MAQDEREQEHRGGRREEHSGEEHGGPDIKPVRRGRVIFALVALALVAVVLAVVGIVPRVRARSRLADQTNSLAAPTVLVAKPARGQPSEEVILPGNIQAFTDSPIYSRTSGYLRKWYFDIGAHVRKGQVLAEIESPEVDQQLAQAQADLATAQANAGNAQTNAKRYNDLLKSDAVSQQEVDQFNTQASSTSTVVKSALANVERVQQLVGFEKITAPFDGVITARNVDTGQLVSSGSGTELFHLAAVSTLRVYVNVPQTYSHAAVPGTTADLTFAEMPGKRFKARLVRSSGQIDPVSRTLLAELEVDNRSGELTPGAYTEVHLKMKDAVETYVIPVSALMYRSEGLRVGTVVAGNKARLVPIVVGQDDGRTVQLISGLDGGAQVITDPPDSLIDGEVVQVSTQRADAGGAQASGAGQGGAGSHGGGAGQRQGGHNTSTPNTGAANTGAANTGSSNSGAHK